MTDEILYRHKPLHLVNVDLYVKGSFNTHNNLHPVQRISAQLPQFRAETNSMHVTACYLPYYSPQLVQR